MVDFIVWATFDSVWSSFAGNPGVFGGPRDATISPTDDGNINVGQGDEFTYTGIPAGAGQFQGPFEMRSFTMSNGGTAVWMTGVGNSGGIVMPTNEIAYNTFVAGTAFTITSNTVISSFPYANIFVPAGLVVADAMNDTSSTSEDASVTVAVLDNDDGTGNSVTAITQGANGGTVTNNGTSVTYNPNGQFEYLAVGETATDTFTYTITDSDGATDTATVTVTITGANDAPQLGTGTAIGGTESAYNNGRNLGGPALVVTDVDVSDVVTGSVTNVVQSGDKTGVLSDALLLSIAKYVSNDGGPLIDATETSSPTGVFRFNFGTDNDSTRFDFLQAGDTLTLTYTVTATDSSGASDNMLVVLNITGENDAPDAVNDSGTGFGTDEDTSFTTANVLNNDSDVDMGDTFSVSAVDATSANGALITSNMDGTFNYNPNGQFDYLAVGESATDTFTYTITDNNGATDTATVTVNITGVNDAPNWGFSAQTITFDEDFINQGLNIAVNANNPQLTDSDVSDVVTSSLSVVQSGDKAGVLSDAEIVSISHVIRNSGGSNTLLDGTETQAGDIIFRLNLATDNSPTRFDFLQAGDVLTLTYTVTATDSQGATDTYIETVNITGVNDDPDAVNDSGSGFGTDEDTSFTTANVLANDSDADMGDVLSVSSFDATSTNGALITSNGDGTFNYNPNGQFEYLAVGESATDTFTYTVSDGNGGTDTATVTIDITGVNDAPVINAGGGIGLSETEANSPFLVFGGAGLWRDVDTSDVVTGTISEVTQTGDGAGVLSEADILSILNLLPDGAGTIASGGVVISSGETEKGVGLFFNGSSPTRFDFLGSGDVLNLTIEFTATDSQGATGTGVLFVAIVGENDAPVAVDDNGMGFGTDEDTSFTTVSVLANDSDVDMGDVLSVSSFDATSANGALITSNGDGTFNYDPNGQFEYLAVGESTTDTFTYTVSDGNGGTDTATVTIDITGVNDAPVAVDDSGLGYETDEDTNFTTANVLANDTDVDASDILSVDGVDAVSANGALITSNGDGTFNYDPNGQFEYLAVGESTTDTFTYTVTDGNGGFDTATVTVTINGVNNAPEARDDYCYNVEGEDISGNVLDNDTDVDASDTLSATLLMDVSHGTLLLQADGSFTYTPNAGFVGVDQFTYEVSDGNGGTDVATVTLVSGTTNGGVFFGDDTAETFPGLGEDLYGSDLIDGRGGNDLIYALTGDDDVKGGSGDDTIAGGKGDDSIKGQGGDDIIVGDAAGKDEFKGPDGNDTLFGNGGDDKIAGQSGDDSIQGNDGRDEIQGNDGRDTLKGNAGDDLISGGADRDRIYGNGGDDELCGDGGNDIIRGGFGQDLIFGGLGSDFLNGEDGDDTILGGNGRDTIVGGDGDDLGFGGAGVDFMKGNDGNDTLVGGNENGRGDDITGNDGDDLIFGEQGEDNLQGSDGQDTILGGRGADDLDGGKDEDVLLGEEGDDDVDGGAGDDKLFGGSGDDSLNGNDDDDFMEGEDGHDDLRGGHGNDTMLGGTGDDSISGSDAFDVEPGFFGDDGDDKIFGENGDDVLEGVNGNDFIDGGNHDDLISGGNGDDILRGESGFDTIFGGEGNDQIDGGGASDLLSGGFGDDTVLGAGGNDTIAGNDGDDCLDGEDGNDFVSGGAGNDTMDGSSGDDALAGNDGDDVIQSGSGNDFADGGSGDDLMDAGDSATILFDLLPEFVGGDTLLGGTGNDTLFTSGSGDYFFDGEEDDDLVIGGDDLFGLSSGLDYLFGGEHDDTIVGRQGVNVMFGEEGADDFIIDIVVTTDANGNITDLDANGDFGSYIFDFDGNQEDQICFNITLTDGSVANFGAQAFFAALDDYTTLSKSDLFTYTPERDYEEGGLIFTDNDLVIEFDNGSFIYIRDVSENTIFEIGEVQSLNPFTDTPKNFQSFWQTDEEVLTWGFDQYEVPSVTGVDKDVMDMDRPEMPVGPFETPSDDFTKTELMDIFEAFVH